MRQGVRKWSAAPNCQHQLERRLEETPSTRPVLGSCTNATTLKFFAFVRSTITFALPENAGRGVIQLNGRMVERLHAELAERTLAIARRITALAETIAFGSARVKA